MARGRCLHGPQRVALSRWPRSDEILLQFEENEPQLEYLLRTESLLRPGPMWLVKITSDGLAYEARSLHVRAGGRYILVSTLPIEPCEQARPVKIVCEGVHGLLFELPDALTRDWEGTLRRLGVTQAKSIEVWPAGLAAIAWDGEGHGEWLASERPCLAVRSDHSIGALLVSMGSGPVSSLALTASPGEPIFIELPPLAVGLHKVSFSVQSGRGRDAQHLGDLDVSMPIPRGTTLVARRELSWAPVGRTGAHRADSRATMGEPSGYRGARARGASDRVPCIDVRTRG